MPSNRLPTSANDSAINNDPNSLHGGTKGFDKQIYTARPFTAEDGPALELSRTSPDREEGYPGALTYSVTYTLTSPGCPIGPQVSEQIEEFVSELDGVQDVQSTMTFTPPWTPELMSEDAKFALGF